LSVFQKKVKRSFVPTLSVFQIRFDKSVRLYAIYIPQFKRGHIGIDEWESMIKLMNRYQLNCVEERSNAF